MDNETLARAPNPKRVAAGRRNRALRQGLTDAGREKLRQAACLHQPWRFSTGPKTKDGKAQSRINGKKRQLGPLSVREINLEMKALRVLIHAVRACRSS